ncbi:MAG: DUF4260 domain-containing protein [Sphingobacteriales bacterium]|nr:DUF4260 domain-containing protein [Sphingobacteriales bacterium]
MKLMLKLEELGMFLLSILLFSQLHFTWWIYPALLLAPDISMSGYLVNPRIGAYGYNLFHHKLLAIVIGIAGLYLQNEWWMLAGIILFGHSSFDRILGYGLKHTDSFKNTHLGKL